MSDHPGDNPKDRIIAFLLGFGGFLVFGGILFVVGKVASSRAMPDPAGEARLVFRREVDRSQAIRLEKLGLEDFGVAAEELAGRLALRAVGPSKVPVPGTAAAAAAMDSIGDEESVDDDGSEDSEEGDKVDREAASDACAAGE